MMSPCGLQALSAAEFDRAACLVHRLTFHGMGREKFTRILDFLNRLPLQPVNPESLKSW
jgi:hypothetical protein